MADAPEKVRFRPQCSTKGAARIVGHTVEIPAPPVRIVGDLWIPPRPTGLVVFAHCSGTNRLSSRGRQVAHALNGCGYATLLPDLRTAAEESTRPGLCDVESLTKRLMAATQWAIAQPHLDGLPVGYLGASTGAAAALCAAAALGETIVGVVSRGGRPDLFCGCLDRVKAPTLLIVGNDQSVVALNEMAASQLNGACELREIPDAMQRFAEPGAPERIAELAAAWFARHLAVGEEPSAERESAPDASSGWMREKPPSSGRVSADDRRSDWAYLPWTKVNSKGGSRWLAS